jgi:hypothetical protein
MLIKSIGVEPNHNPNPNIFIHILKNTIGKRKDCKKWRKKQ